jgi:threonine dehydratase
MPPRLAGMLVEFPQVIAAQQAMAGAVHRTPIFSATQFGETLGLSLWLKAELFQKTGSFKPRGALNRLRNTPREDLDRGLISASAGNHAQGLAWAARQVGAACTVVMPAQASPTKAAATRGYGAEVILEGSMEQVFDIMRRIQEDRGHVFVHPFDDPLVIAGQGTIGLEIVEQVPEVEVIVCPLGGGGLISGIALAAKSLRPEVLVYGVEPNGAAAMRRSWDEGRPVRLDSLDTIADGLASPMAGEVTYPMTRRYVDDVIVLSDEEILDGLTALLNYAKLYAEPAGAAATAALLAGKVPLRRGQTVVSVVSGGNFDLDRLGRVLGG